MTTWVLWAFITGHAIAKIDDYYETKEDCLHAAEQTSYVYSGRPSAMAFGCTPSADYMKAKRKLETGDDH
jgi:hypothetical protein